MNSRQTLLWHAMKAKKKNLIDSNELETIRKLSKDPDDAKVSNFLESFLLQLGSKDSFLVVSNPPIPFQSAPSSICTFSALENLPQSILSEEVTKFLSRNDILSLAQTSFSLNQSILPADSWGKTILKLLDEEGVSRLSPFVFHESVFPHLRIKHKPTRSEALSLFSIGFRFLQLDGPAQVENGIMIRFLLPLLPNLHIKLVCELNQIPSGDALMLVSISPSSNLQHLLLQFTTKGVPPVLCSQGNSSKFSLHALEANRFRISCLHSFRCVRQGHHVHLRSETGVASGQCSITTCGERSAKWLGKTLHQDEFRFQVELSSTSNSGHGLANQINMGYIESVTKQTPRTTFRVPEGFFEVRTVLLSVPVGDLFLHSCVRT